jgi:uncharacterized protein (DUF2062 family)
MNLALSIGFGVFMGIVPIWGYQLVTAIFLAYLLKLNKVIVAIAANISIPPMIPVILYLSLKTGEFITRDSLNIGFSHEISISTIKSVLYVYLIGSVVFAGLSFMVASIASYLLLSFTRKIKPSGSINNL